MNALKVYFSPEFTAQVWATTISVGFLPDYVVHDVNQLVEFPTTTIADTFLQYANLKVMNMQRPWKYYRKKFRNVVTARTASVLSNRGYVSTSVPVQT